MGVSFVLIKSLRYVMMPIFIFIPVEGTGLLFA